MVCRSRPDTLAIDDPVLYFDCPVDHTAHCGFDVLAHASEPSVSRLNFQPSLGNALHAIRLTPQHLRHRFADIAEVMGIDTHGMTKPQAADAAQAAAIRLLRDVGIPEKFADVTQDSYSKNRLGNGPTKFYENAPTIVGDVADVDRITGLVEPTGGDDAGAGDQERPATAEPAHGEARLSQRPVAEDDLGGLELDETRTARRRVRPAGRRESTRTPGRAGERPAPTLEGRWSSWHLPGQACAAAVVRLDYRGGCQARTLPCSKVAPARPDRSVDP